MKYLAITIPLICLFATIYLATRKERVGSLEYAFSTLSSVEVLNENQLGKILSRVDFEGSEKLYHHQLRLSIKNKGRKHLSNTEFTRPVLISSSLGCFEVVPEAFGLDFSVSKKCNQLLLKPFNLNPDEELLVEIRIISSVEGLPILSLSSTTIGGFKLVQK